MSIPLLQKLAVGSYVVRQHLAGRKRYPLVLMLEPLFRCNLACAGCGKRARDRSGKYAVRTGKCTVRDGFGGVGFGLGFFSSPRAASSSLNR